MQQQQTDIFSPAAS